jgi:putative ABC transport system permease protein
LCLVSSVSPILKINRIPVKDIILNAVESRKTSKLLRAIAGIIVVGFGVFAPLLVTGKYSVYINALCIVAVIAGLVLLIPFLTRITIRLLELIYSAAFGNVGRIAVKNLRENRSAYGSISLLAIGISCILFVNILSFSTLAELDNYYKRNTYEIYMQAKNVDPGYLQQIRTTPGVKDVAKVTGIGGLEIVNKGDVIALTEGVDTKNYLSYNNLVLSGDRQDKLDLLDKGRGILVANGLRDRYDLKLGEVLELRAWGKVTDYTIVGFFPSIDNFGSYALISDKYMKLDIGWDNNYYSTLLIKTEGDPDKAVENLRARFVKQQPYIITNENRKKEMIHYNEQIYLIAKGFSIITMFAGILGIFNNLIINFIRRRRHLAMYRSVGMSKHQIIGMIFTEALTLGIIGSLTGVLSGILMISSGAGLFRSLHMIMGIHYSVTQLVLSVVLGIVISIIASVWPALKAPRELRGSVDVAFQSAAVARARHPGRWWARSL